MADQNPNPPQLPQELDDALKNAVKGLVLRGNELNASIVDAGKKIIALYNEFPEIDRRDMFDLIENLLDSWLRTVEGLNVIAKNYEHLPESYEEAQRQLSERAKELEEARAKDLEEARQSEMGKGKEKEQE